MKALRRDVDDEHPRRHAAEHGSQARARGGEKPLGP
jgi:hypothetical protein